MESLFVRPCSMSYELLRRACFSGWAIPFKLSKSKFLYSMMSSSASSSLLEPSGPFDSPFRPFSALPSIHSLIFRSLRSPHAYTMPCTPLTHRSSIPSRPSKSFWTVPNSFRYFSFSLRRSSIRCSSLSSYISWYCKVCFFWCSNRCLLFCSCCFSAYFSIFIQSMDFCWR